jgi:hypothetical protein
MAVTKPLSNLMKIDNSEDASIKSHLMVTLTFVTFLVVNIITGTNTKAWAIETLNPSDPTRIASADKNESTFGIIEKIDKKHRKNFDKWKRAFCATKTGAALWNQYANDKSFKLVITIGPNAGGNKGAEIGKWGFDELGNLTEATITLGPEVGTGVPSILMYPILGALVAEDVPHSVGTPYSREAMVIGILAHEFGHLTNIRLVGPIYKHKVSLSKQLLTRYQTVGPKGLRNDPQLVQIMAQLKSVEIHSDNESEELAERTTISVLKDYFGKRIPSRLLTAMRRFAKRGH